MSFLLSISMLLVLPWGYSQGYIEYHNRCNSAAENIEQGQFLEAKESLVMAISSVEHPLDIDLFNLAKCYSQLNQRDSTLHLLHRCTESYNFLLNDLIERHDQWFAPILGKKSWEKFLIQRPTQATYTPFQDSLRKKVEIMVKADQHYRNILSDSIKVYHPDDSLLIQTYKDSMQLVDQKNGEMLEEMIDEHGWPGQRLLGFGPMTSTLLIHVSNEWFEKNKHKLLQEIDKGNLMPWEYADIADRKLFEKNEPILYNAYFFTNKEFTDDIIKNCHSIGAPLGETRKLRAYLQL